MRRSFRGVRLPIWIVVALVALAAMSAVAGAAPSDKAAKNYRASLQPLPLNPAASGTADITRVGNVITVDVHATGLTPFLPHAMHIHGDLQARNECPAAGADVNTGDPGGEPGTFIPGTPDGLISLTEGAPFYGPVQVSFTTDPHPTTPAVGLTLAFFPTADANGVLEYHRTFAIPGNIAAKLGRLHVVVHGNDLDQNGAYSNFMEATLPVACGTIAEG